ncbi:MAG: DUF499 domain-containing protein [Thermodesulfobacteriota bacterium]|nr:DUF499 domain-containing protein [Thermodesulfobacteriota bacterium]
MPERLRPWFEVVRLHPDVEGGRLAMATFAIDFGGVLANSEGVPLVYRDSRSFWQATHLTGGIRRLLEEVLDRLCGRAGDRVLQLRSPFGGGKSHVLVALYHATKNRKAFEEEAPDCKSLPNPGKVQIAGIDGEKFDPTVGRKIDGTTVHTLWGALGAQLGCFDLVREHEKGKSAPAGDPVKAMLGDKPVLILFDEVLQYVERAMTIPVGESNLGRQTLEFLQTLTTEVANSMKAVMVYSLQASTREALDNIGLLTMLDHLAARVDAKREPVVGDEILDVLKKRLLSEIPPSDVAKQVATAVAQSVTQWKMAEAPDNSARRAAEDEKVRLARRLETAYPFHVGLIDLMKERWASIPDFQRTRGALRFLAAVLHKAKKLTRQSVFVCPGDIPIDDADVRNAFFTEVGQREPFQAALEHDFIGANARAKRIDNQVAEQNPALASVRPAMRLATTILMYSFGGLPREEKGEPLPSGVSEKELLEVCLSVEIDNLTAQSVLKRLRDECLYLHYDGVHYCFKTIANVNMILENEADNVQPKEIREFIKQDLETRIGKTTNAAIIWPDESSKIPDAEPRFVLGYLPLEFSEKKEREQEQTAIELLTQCGVLPRRFRNGIGLAISDKRQLEGLRRSAKYLLAIERVRQKKASYKLTKDQMEQLKEREQTEKSGFESGVRALYPAVLLLKMENGKPAIDKAEIGARPLKEQGVHERLIELLGKNVSSKLFDEFRASKLLPLMQMGTGKDEKKAVGTKVIRDVFFESLDFPRVTEEKAIASAIAQGVKDGIFAYALKSKVLEEAGKYSVKEKDLIFGRTVSADEINLDAGFILLPECIIEEAPPGPGPIPPGPTPPGPTPPGPTPPGPTPTEPGKIRAVRMDMKVNKQTHGCPIKSQIKLAG